MESSFVGPDFSAELRRTRGPRQGVERNFETILDMAGITDFRLHELRNAIALLVHDERRRSLRVSEKSWTRSK